MSARPQPPYRDAFARFVPIETRWADNDVYGHVNNVVYYAFFDTAVNRLLVEAGLLDPVASDVYGVVVETNCAYFASVAFPDALEVGLRVESIGRSSVRYALGVFRKGEAQASAAGAFTHVYVARATQRPVEMPAPTRAFLATLRMNA